MPSNVARRSATFSRSSPDATSPSSAWRERSHQLVKLDKLNRQGVPQILIPVDLDWVPVESRQRLPDRKTVVLGQCAHTFVDMGASVPPPVQDRQGGPKQKSVRMPELANHSSTVNPPLVLTLCLFGSAGILVDDSVQRVDPET